LAASAQILRRIIERQIGEPGVSEGAPIGELGITQSPDTLSIFVWRVFDAFFVDLDPQEISLKWTALDISPLLNSRQPADEHGLTPVGLFLTVQRALGRKEEQAPSVVYWDDNAYLLHRKMEPARKTWLTYLRWADWAYDDLLDDIDRELGHERDLTKSLWGRANVGICEAAPTVRLLVNYLWRLSGSASDRPARRFTLNQLCHGKTGTIIEAARLSVVRLLLVIGVIESVSVEDSEPLDEMFARSRDVGAAKHWVRGKVVRAMRYLLDFELRTTFSIYPRGSYQKVYGGVRFGLPRRIKTFADLVAYVANGWRSAQRNRETKHDPIRRE
jgi:hypothetical protein